MQSLVIRRPDDWHLHVRDGAALTHTVAATAAVFARAIIMPNLKVPITTVIQAAAYKERILEACDSSMSFEPLMTLYLTDNTSVSEIYIAKASGLIHGCKLYPAGATTNSDSGVTSISHITKVLAAMAEVGLPLLVHGEVTDKHVDIFDREKTFIDLILNPLLEKIPSLRVVLEHITTRDAVNFVLSGSENLAATITPQHLLFNRNDMLAGGIRPHLYCLPILKRQIHQQALREVVASGHPRFFLGTDSAPHAKLTKESDCGCAGCYSAPVALPLYATIFEELNALDKLEAFASINGANWYGVPINEECVELTRRNFAVPTNLPFLDDAIVPLMAGCTLPWRLNDAHFIE
jgi:dihydroorotase